MVDIAIARMSSKGQIVIPQEMRQEFKQGEKVVILKKEGKLLLRPASDFGERLAEDVEFAKRTEEALRRYERGEFITMEFDEFLREVKKW